MGPGNDRSQGPSDDDRRSEDDRVDDSRERHPPRDGGGDGNEDGNEDGPEIQADDRGEDGDVDPGSTDPQDGFEWQERERTDDWEEWRTVDRGRDVDDAGRRNEEEVSRNEDEVEGRKKGDIDRRTADDQRTTDDRSPVDDSTRGSARDPEAWSGRGPGPERNPKPSADDTATASSSGSGSAPSSGGGSLEGPPPEPGTTAAAERGRQRDRGRSSGDQGILSRFLTAQEGPAVWMRDVVTSVVIVLAIGALLFAVSGVWPPMVAVESGSMDPNMEKGDLIVVTEPGRLAPDAATNDVGVVTQEVAEREGYQSFGAPGSVIVYTFPGRVGSPIIHRSMFHVEAGENWVDRADPRYLNAETCADVQNCPAPHSGFITKGDNNGRYDQASGIAPPVKPEWVTGVARVRIPYLGWIRLVATGQATTDEFIEAVTSGTLGTGGTPGVGGTPGAGGTPGVSGPMGGPSAMAITGAAAVGVAAVRRARG